MSKKYWQNQDIKAFFYTPNARYYAVIAKGKEELRSARETVLDFAYHELPDERRTQMMREYEQKALEEKNGYLAQLIHVKHDISRNLAAVKTVKGVRVDVSPIVFDSSDSKTADLRRLLIFVLNQPKS